jgi:subtilisin family serine protease
VYVLDTGIRTSHEQFYDPSTQRSRALQGFDAVDNGGTSEDCHGHGSHVAAVVGGEQSLMLGNATLVVLHCSAQAALCMLTVLRPPSLKPSAELAVLLHSMLQERRLAWPKM